MRKEYVMGNGAIALGALAAGLNLVAGYPGTPSSGSYWLSICRSENLGVTRGWTSYIIEETAFSGSAGRKNIIRNVCGN